MPATPRPAAQPAAPAAPAPFIPIAPITVSASPAAARRPHGFRPAGSWAQRGLAAVLSLGITGTVLVSVVGVADGYQQSVRLAVQRGLPACSPVGLVAAVQALPADAADPAARTFARTVAGRPQRS